MSLNLAESQETSLPSSQKNIEALGLKIINLDYLDKIAPGNQVFFIEMMDLFKSESGIFIDKVTAELQERDFISIARTAHAMKPMGSYIGADDLTQLVGALEKESREADVVSITATFNQIKEMINAVNREINQFISFSK